MLYINFSSQAYNDSKLTYILRIEKKEGKRMKVKKFVRIFLCANLLLLFVFTFLPILILNPELDSLQSLLKYMNKD